MQTGEPSFLLNDLIAMLSERGRELLVEVRDPFGFAASLPIVGARAPELAKENDLTLCKNSDDRLINDLLHSCSLFVATNRDVFSRLPPDFVQQRVFLLSPQPRLFLSMLLVPFYERPSIAWQEMAVHPSAQIATSVTLARGVVIGPDVTIRSGCVIGPNTVIDHAVIGADTQIGSNCSIGGDGFGFEVDEGTGSVIKFPHLGSVHIGERVEISANVTIDRGSLRDTILEDEVKVDNLVYIAHNCHIKRGALIMANATLLGSVTVGEYAWIAPSTSILNGMDVGRCGMTGVGSVVVNDVGNNTLVVGSPARKLRNRLPEDSPLIWDDDANIKGLANS